jgi:hypothetical protein
VDTAETATREEILARLARAGRLVEERVRPDGFYDGWSGKDVLCHLAAYARLVGAVLGAEAEGRRATDRELYGRDLTADELALGGLDEVNEAIRREYAALGHDEALAFWRVMHAAVVAQVSRLPATALAAPGPSYPPAWSRPHLADVVSALIDHYDGHMAGRP